MQTLKMELPSREASLAPPDASSNECALSLETMTFAAERANLLFGCYRKGEANDPETYTLAVAAVLADYEPEVIRRVTDPRTGIPRKLKFMPNPAEIAEACEAEKKFIMYERKAAALGWHWNGEKWEHRQQAD